MPPLATTTAAHARDIARAALLDRRTAEAHWEGCLSSSALATATAVVALATAVRVRAGAPGDELLAAEGARWLAANINADGGWGDTTDSVSNISTTALAWSALAFADGVAPAVAGAEAWLARAAGGLQPEALAGALAERYGKDRTFSVPILTMCAIAGRLGPPERAWRLIPQLPFELAALPRRLFGVLRLPVVSYALPALIAMGLARHRRASSAPPVSVVRSAIAPRVLDTLRQLQPHGGGFLEAVPLTSFVTMSLIAAGEHQHPVVSKGLEFLRRSVRRDGSWPIDTNLATWVTTLSINALASGTGLSRLDARARRRLRDWLLRQQGRVAHPYTGAAPGAWAWTDLPGGVPDADDTAGALIALRHLAADDSEVAVAAAAGVRWLLGVQNRDGGVPTFCRGWGTLPFDRSSTDLTAHAIRAWTGWRDRLPAPLSRQTDRAVARAVDFLRRSQRADGAFVPLWFGNQHEAREENPVFGTSRVLPGVVAAEARGVPATAAIRQSAATWLVRTQNRDGGWGGGPAVASTIEESAAAVSGLAAIPPGDRDAAVRAAIDRGVDWLVQTTAGGRHFPPSPIGLYFARLWYSEELYPLIFTVGALEAAVDR